MLSYSTLPTDVNSVWIHCCSSFQFCHKTEVRSKVHKDTFVFNFSDIFFIFNLFKWNKTVYKAVLCPTSISSSWKSYADKRWLHGRFLGLTLRVHVKSSLGDVHAKVSLLHLSATFCFPPSIKSSFDLLLPFGCCVLSQSEAIQSYGHAQSVFLPQAVWGRQLETKRRVERAVCGAIPGLCQVSVGFAYHF